MTDFYDLNQAALRSAQQEYETQLEPLEVHHHIRLSILAMNALKMIVLEYSRQENLPQEWKDAFTGECVTTNDLLTILSREEEDENESIEKGEIEESDRREHPRDEGIRIPPETGDSSLIRDSAPFRKP